MKHHVILPLLLLALIVSSTALTSAQDKKQQAQRSAETWLKLIDSGDYAKSWQEASSSFKAAVSQPDWEKQLRAVRVPLGAVVSRQLQSAEYTTKLPGAPDGQYVVIRYDTSFEHKKTAVETIVPALDKDGQWRVSGYFIK